MSNQARRVLAIVICSAVGVICLIEGTRRMGSGHVSSRMLAITLLLVAGFLLLSAVGLAKPYLPKPPRPRG